MQRVVINRTREYCYRICHIRNLSHILATGLCTKHHPDADPNFIPIGNPGIISVRDDFPVDYLGYGNIGDYVPFYFTPKSLMQYNIVTGFWAPAVPKLHPENILIIQCRITDLTNGSRFFFTNGQANTRVTTQYIDLQHLNQIDWESIQHGNFSKSDGDYDRSRRYQAEFLVHHHVPIEAINALFVYNNKGFNFVNKEITDAGNEALKVNIEPRLFFEP